MSWLSRLLRRKQFETDLDRELSYHMERQIQDLVDRGISREQAARRTRLEFGGLDQVKEAVRDARGTAWLQDLFRDIRYGCRLLLRSPVFSSVAVLSLALGIGATTAVFTLMDRVVLRDMPVHKPAELIEFIRYQGPGRSNHAYPHFEQLRENLRSFDGMLAEAWLGELEVSIGGQPENATVEMVNGEYFRVLGVEPAIGRTFGADDDRVPGAHPVAVISHRYWVRRFASDPAVIGKRIWRLWTKFTIVGVAPPGFDGVVFGRAADVAIPVSMVAEVRGGTADRWLHDPARHWLAVMGRLKAGVSLPRAEAEVNMQFAHIVDSDAKSGARPGSPSQSQRMELRRAANGIEDWRRDLTEPLAILMTTVALLLLLACANVANLLLTKSAVRQREIAVRLAIGAGRGRVARQMVAEGLLLTLAGGVVGVALGYGLATALVTMLANGGPPIAVATAPDARVLAFALALVVTTCLLFSLAPVAQAMRANVQTALAQARSSPWTLGRGLVTAEVAFAAMLLIGATLFGRSLFQMRSQDNGFREGGLLLFSTNLARLGYPTERVAPLWERLRKEIETIPGVESATLSTVPPVSGGSGWDAKVRVEGSSHLSDQASLSHGNRVGPRYFQTYGTPILAGRDFAERDASSLDLVAIVNASFARSYFGTESPIGRRIRLDYPGLTQWREIVGVVRDMKYESIRGSAPSAVYFPAGQLPIENATFALRTPRDAASMAAEIRAAVSRVYPGARALNIRTMENHVSRSILTERMLALLGAFFAGLALLLAAIGIYGVTAYQVAARRREIGIRMAVGASAERVLGMVLWQTAVLALTGCVIGAAGAWALSRFAAGFLFGIEAGDPLSFLSAIAGLLLIALGAGYLPGRNASRTDPSQALRAE
jgi:predicted permease